MIFHKKKNTHFVCVYHNGQIFMVLKLFIKITRTCQIKTDTTCFFKGKSLEPDSMLSEIHSPKDYDYQTTIRL